MELRHESGEKIHSEFWCRSLWGSGDLVVSWENRSELEMNGTNSGSCLIAGTDVSDAESFDSNTAVT